MKLPLAEPFLTGSGRARKAKVLRDLATEMSRLHPQALTRANGEEADHGAPTDDGRKPVYPANFTKGLPHDDDGLLETPSHYRCFVEAINADDSTLFEKHVAPDDTSTVPFKCKWKATGTSPNWRGWESPRAGHAYELQGPDAGAVGMAPAPRVGSSELAAEMAEVYGLALLRDVPFTEICAGGKAQIEGKGESILSADEIAALLSDMPFFDGDGVVSSTPHAVDGSGLNRFERNRRFGRTLSADGPVTAMNAFRGSTKGAQIGPYISQFMLIGAPSLAGPGGGASSFPGRDATWDLVDGFVPFGTQPIDQRSITHKACLDYMTNWGGWLDVQNGANFKRADRFEKERRFITTPRDLATYVHFDALYQAYLNACLVLLGLGAKASKGFPEPSPSGHRDAFATFGGPHVLSLVTEVATRCLKAVRRQKFNYHRRARPEAIGGRLTVAALGHADKMGCAEGAFARTLAEMPPDLLDAIAEHNAAQNEAAMDAMRAFDCDPIFPCGVDKATFDASNYLLPMAFPEGSPMHPAYGAGHATVAGGCVTMLKAFFEMFEDCDSGVERPLTVNGAPVVYVPTDDGKQLKKDPKFAGPLTIQGELDKLAANIAIGRNMAGVHYYSDYYDSLRMGERIAVGILMEQCPSYVENVETTFKSFDGDLITISGLAGSAPSISILDRSGVPVLPSEWWLRHVSGAETMEDL